MLGNSRVLRNTLILVIALSVSATGILLLPNAAHSDSSTAAVSDGQEAVVTASDPLPATSQSERPLIVNSTIVLANGTQIPGNYTPPDLAGPESLAYDSGRGEIFAASPGSRNLSVISDSSNEIVSVAALNMSVEGLVYDSGTSQVFAAGYYCTFFYFGYCLGTAGLVQVVNDTTYRVVANISVDNVPRGMAYDPTQGEVLVPIGGMNQVAVINDSTDTVVANVTVGTQPWAVAFDGATDQAYVANNQSNNISIFAGGTNLPVANVAVGTGPVAVAYDPDVGAVFVANSGSSNVSVIADATDEVTASIPLNGSPTSLAYDPATQEIFVGWSHGSYFGNVSVISGATDRVVANVTLGDPVDGLAYDGGLHELFATDNYYGYVVVISTATDQPVTTVWFTATPDQMAFDFEQNEVFVTDYVTGDVLVVSGSTGRVLDRIAVGDASGEIAYDSGKGEVFVANQFFGNVTVISDTTDRIVTSVSAPNWVTPYALAYDAAKGEVFVGDYDTNNVSVVNDSTDQVVATIPVGSEPFDMTYDSARGEIFVANSNSSNVSIISDSTNRVVATLNLAHGSSPTALVYDPGKGEVFVYDSSTVLGENYLDAVSDLSNRVVARVALPVVTNLGALTYDPAQNAVVFSDSETGWNGLVVVSDKTDRINQWLATVGALAGGTGTGPIGLAYDARTSTVYAANFWQGTLSLVTPSTITFLARGMYPGTTWSITGGSPLNNQSNTTMSSGGASPAGEVSFLAPVGVFDFNVSVWGGEYGVARISGPGVVNQTAIDVTGPETVVITFGYWVTLTFNESSPTVAWPGLPSWASWGVTLTPTHTGGPPAQASFSTAGSSIEFTVPAGAAYHFQVTKPSTYRASPGKGDVTVGEFGTTKLVRFKPVTAVVKFVERGLPTGTLWGVNLTGPESVDLAGSAGAALYFALTNGTYNFSVFDSAGVSAISANGSFVVVAPHAPSNHVVEFGTPPSHETFAVVRPGLS